MGASESQTGSLHTLAAVRQRRVNIASQNGGRQRLHPHSMFTLNENNKFQYHIIGPSALFGDGEFLLIQWNTIPVWNRAYFMNAKMCPGMARPSIHVEFHYSSRHSH